jgi:CHAT domain-containing protein
VALVHASRSGLDQWLRLAPHVGRSGYDEVLRFKGLVARATAAERRLARRGDPEGADRVEGLRAAERRVSRLANDMPPAYQKERFRAWQEQYARGGAEREALALGLARDLAPLREGLERMDLTAKDVTARLPADAVLVDFLRSGEGYLAWVLRSEGEVERFDLGEAAAIETAAEEFARLTRDETTGPASPEWLAAGRRLHDLVLAPWRSRLGPEARTLYLCPDAALAAIPFAALPGRQAGSFLIDDHLLVQVSMAQDLVPWPGREAGKGALLLGDVDYGHASETGGETPFAAAGGGLAVLDRAPRGRSFEPLPETRQEVEFARTLIGDSTALTGREATEARLRSEVHGKRLLHLATHGFVREDLMAGLRRREGDRAWLGSEAERQLAAGHDPLLLAGLALAGANPREGGHGDDGILTAAEASCLDLDGVDLVVLSACQTALGRSEAGEGVIGLVQAFQMAGARRVVASLWPVDDEATRRLMERLYAGLLRKDDPLAAAQALREAALSVRGATGKGGRPFSAPRHWAAFAAYGR